MGSVRFESYMFSPCEFKFKFGSVLPKMSVLVRFVPFGFGSIPISSYNYDILIMPPPRRGGGALGGHRRLSSVRLSVRLSV